MVLIEVPVKVVSEANDRGHFRRKHQRSRQQKLACEMSWVQAGRPSLVGMAPAQVTLTRVAPRGLDDDNLARGFKSIRDWVASKMGLDDKPGSGLTWVYQQERGEVRQYRATIEITPDHALVYCHQCGQVIQGGVS